MHCNVLCVASNLTDSAMGPPFCLFCYDVTLFEIWVEPCTWIDDTAAGQ